MKAKHITPRPLAISSTDPSTAGGVAATPCERATIAATTSSTTVIPLPMPPMLLIHLPTPIPRTLATVMIASQPKAIVATNHLSSTRPAVLAPPAKATTPAR